MYLSGAVFLVLILCTIWYIQNYAQRSRLLVSDKYTRANPLRVVIVGGSFAGLKVLRTLLRYTRGENLQLILIDQKDYAEYTPSLLNILMNPEQYTRIISPLRGGMDHTFILGRVVEVTDDFVRVVDKAGKEQNVGFDHLVLACGSQYTFPFKFPRLQSPRQCQAWSEEELLKLPVLERTGAFLSQFDEDPVVALQAALRFGRDLDSTEWTLERGVQPHTIQHVQVVGGGAVAVELAAEIVYKFGSPQQQGQFYDASKVKKEYLDDVLHPNVVPPVRSNGIEQLAKALCVTTGDPQVTLISNTPTLLPGFPKKAVDYVQDWFLSHGANIVVNYSCDLGKLASSDGVLVCPCAGLQPVDIAISGLLTSTEKGWFKTHPTMMTEGSHKSSSLRKVWALGDCVAPLPGGKLAMPAEMQALVISHNIVAYAQDHTSTLQEYPRDPFFAVDPPLLSIISLGPTNAVMVFNELCISGSFAALSKYFIEWTKVREAREWATMSLLWIAIDEVICRLNYWMRNRTKTHNK